jgi:hypothetical protein
MTGPFLIQEYLYYAKSISESNLQESVSILHSLGKDSASYENGKQPATTEECLENQIQDRLQKDGYKVDVQVGNSDYKIDLAIVHPDLPSKYILAIE